MKSRINVEIKSRCSHPRDVQRRLESAGARYLGLDRQTDTYFSVTGGRLKLRQGNIENTLIYYRRSDESGPRPSEVLLHHPHDPESLRRLLTRALDVKVVVNKSRHIYFLDNVKVHVDTIRHLGDFIEIEAIGDPAPGIEQRLEVQCREVMTLLGVRSDHLVARSYSDLLLDRMAAPEWTR